METFVKKGNNLIKIGEGKLFKKRDITLLKEIDDNTDDNTITLTNDGESGEKKTPAGELVNNIKQELPKVNAGNKDIQYHVSSDDVAGITSNASPSKNSTQSAPVVKASMNDPNLTNIMQRNASIGNDVVVSKNENRKMKNDNRIIEMRKSSIPFSKKELTRFLKSI
jgi:hypothetical protein